MEAASWSQWPKGGSGELKTSLALKKKKETLQSNLKEHEWSQAKGYFVADGNLREKRVRTPRNKNS